VTRAFRFGVQLWTAPSRSAWRDKVKNAEGLGYDVIVVADHLGEGVAPLQALTAAADASTKLRLGTLVLDNDFRHPVVMAREAAALDVLSEGRFELGLGAGWLGRDYERSGLPFDPPGVRVERLEESVEIVTRALAGESVSFSGRHYEVSGFEVHPRPIQSPVPLMLGAGGRRMLRLAAEHARHRRPSCRSRSPTAPVSARTSRARVHSWARSSSFGPRPGTGSMTSS
jgi:probable F420-dependent oxidoreductase